MKRILIEDLIQAKFRLKYNQHKLHASARKIPFKIVFEDWMRIWVESGHWKERGNKGHQYQMARYGDKGAYEVGNVRIITMQENIIEEHIFRYKNKIETMYKPYGLGCIWAEVNQCQSA